MGNLTSNSTLHGQLTNEIQTGVTIARSHDAFGSLGWGDFNAEAQSRREFECQLVVYSALVADKAATSGQNSTFSFSHSPFACAPTNRHPYTVSYAYDHRGRMVKKEIRANDGSDTLVKSISYLWDGWNIIREIQWPVASDQWSVETLATSHYPLATDYVWGLDLDGTLQGAGGVGGLLAVLRSDCVATNSSFVIRHSSLFFPAYDANGNISEYVSEGGEVVAHYDYSPFGETLIETGDLASTFTHRFSTKPWCPVTGLCEYQMRKYRPEIGRWLSRDPIGELGGFNMHSFVGNEVVNAWDALGLIDKARRTELLIKLIERLRDCAVKARGCRKDDFMAGVDFVMGELFKTDNALSVLAGAIGNSLEDNKFAKIMGAINDAQAAIEKMDIPKMDDIMESIKRYNQAIDSVRLISRGIQLERSKEREKLLPEFLSMISAGISLIGVAGKYAPELSLVANWYTDATKAAIKGIGDISIKLEEQTILLVISSDCKDICSKFGIRPTRFTKGLFQALKCHEE